MVVFFSSNYITIKGLESTRTDGNEKGDLGAALGWFSEEVWGQISSRVLKYSSVLIPSRRKLLRMMKVGRLRSAGITKGRIKPVLW